eukprot:TRINITY_DN8666_c1_g2_i2.p1 TRINITY_DN8666_c1_g2~~TRINITY_DN8666_c1_g2_i2.p1  ORF type:complete len:255 (+),score=-14.64 TRINITY_DN8666_c1_g2_i2:175-939(+)
MYIEWCLIYKKFINQKSLQNKYIFIQNIKKQNGDVKLFIYITELTQTSKNGIYQKPVYKEYLSSTYIGTVKTTKIHQKYKCTHIQCITMYTCTMYRYCQKYKNILKIQMYTCTMYNSVHIYNTCIIMNNVQCMYNSVPMYNSQKYKNVYYTETKNLTLISLYQVTKFEPDKSKNKKIKTTVTSTFCKKFAIEAKLLGAKFKMQDAKCEFFYIVVFNQKLRINARFVKIANKCEICQKQQKQLIIHVNTIKKVKF